MTDRLWTFDDFKDFATIDETFFGDNPSASYDNDAEGYTPLCFAALNGVDPKYFSYFMWQANEHSLEDFVYKKCDRGKTPMQYACMSANAAIVNVLTSGSYSYDRVDPDGNPVYLLDEYGNNKLDSNGEPIVLHDTIPWRLIYNNIVYRVYGFDLTNSTNGDMVKGYEYIFPEINAQDITTAASMTKSDILEILINAYLKDHQDVTWHSDEFLDSNGNTPVHLAVTARCYASVKLLLDNDTNAVDTVSCKNYNNPPQTPLDLAIEYGDTGLQKILLSYVSGAGASDNWETIDEILRYNFSQLNSIADQSSTLDTVFSSKYIFLGIKKLYTLGSGSQSNLASYYDNRTDEALKSTMISDFCNTYTEKICTDPDASGRYFYGKNYEAFLSMLANGYTTTGPSGQIIVKNTLFYPDAITHLYNMLETERNAQDDAPWVTAALIAQGHESSWTSKSSMISWIVDKLKYYISTSLSFIHDDQYFTGSSDEDYVNNAHDRIPVGLWDLDTLINKNFNKSLKRYRKAFGDIAIKDYQIYTIKHSVMNNEGLEYEYVKEYLSVQQCIDVYDYAFMQWLHDSDNLTHSDFVLITDAVNGGTINPSHFTGWPWQDPV